MTSSGPVRQFLSGDAREIAPLLLGAVLTHDSGEGSVAVRITELEAYMGPVDSLHPDPGSHTYRGPTRRNAPMFGPAGHLYVYFVYGMHFCINVVCMTDGVPGAVLLRAGEITTGGELARSRKPAARKDAQLASGPARLAGVLGITREHNGVDLTSPDSPVRLYNGTQVAEDDIRSGPRVGVAAAMDLPWRSWVDGSESVSAYRRGGRRRTRART
jgi:DNA-3-methyladenine glycosylase